MVTSTAQRGENKRTGLRKADPTRLLRNSCRPLKQTRFAPLPTCRHSRAGLSHVATSWLRSVLLAASERPDRASL
jgi:hypothetical protein